MEYSKMVLKIRAKLNITQQQLADILKVNFATVNRWENNKRTPSKRYIILLEELYENNNIDFLRSKSK